MLHLRLVLQRWNQQQYQQQEGSLVTCNNNNTACELGCDNVAKNSHDCTLQANAVLLLCNAMRVRDAAGHGFQPKLTIRVDLRLVQGH